MEKALNQWVACGQLLPQACPHCLPPWAIVPKAGQKIAHSGELFLSLLNFNPELPKSLATRLFFRSGGALAKVRYGGWRGCSGWRGRPLSLPPGSRDVPHLPLECCPSVPDW